MPQDMTSDTTEAEAIIPAPDASADAETPASSPDTEDTSSTQADTDATSSEPQSMDEAVSQAFDEAFQTGDDPSTETTDDDPDATPDADAAETEETAPDTEEGAAENSDGETETEDDDGDEEADPTEEEIAALKPKQAKRVQRLLRQRAAARQEANTLRPDAENYGKLRKFMDQNDLSDPEVADLFKLGADLKSGDPQRLKHFLDKITPFVNLAQEALGMVVPEDLQPQVEAGEMTEQAARTVAQSRRTAELAEGRATRQRERQTAERQAEQTLAAQTEMANALHAWTEQTAASDPDFARKQPAMQAVARGIVAQKGPPKTNEDILAYAKEAYEIVSANARPARKPTRPSPSTSATPSRSGVTQDPTSLEDIVTMGLQHTG